MTNHPPLCTVTACVHRVKMRDYCAKCIRLLAAYRCGDLVVT